MALFDLTKWGASDEAFAHPPRECFVCGEILAEDIVVYWQGTIPGRDLPESQIWMHPDCALHLSNALAHDGIEGRDVLQNRKLAAMRRKR